MPPSPPAHSRITTSADLTAHFRAFLRLLNTRLWSNLGTYVAPRVELNGRRYSTQGFARLTCTGSIFTAHMVVADAGKRTIAVRLDIEIPSASGNQSRLVQDHVFYHFDDEWRIDEAWSVRLGTNREREIERERERAEPCHCSRFVSHELHTPAQTSPTHSHSPSHWPSHSHSHSHSLSQAPRRPIGRTRLSDTYPELPVPVQLVARRQSVSAQCEVSAAATS